MTRIAILSLLFPVIMVYVLYVDVTSAADDELHQLGLDHLDIIGTRFIDEHHDIHDYPNSKSDSSDKSDDKHDKSDDKNAVHGSSEESDDKDYHNPIYDHVNIDKDDYSQFGHESSDSKDSHDKSDDKSHS